MNSNSSVVLLNNRPRMRAAQLAQWLRGAIALISLISFWFHYRLWQRILLGGEITAEEATANNLRVQLIDGAHIVLGILAFIALAMWSYRAYENVHRLPHARPAHSRNTAGLAWVIPIMNFWYPFLIMRDIWRYIGRFSHSPAAYLSPRKDYIVVIWWVLYLIVIIMSRVVTTITRTAPSTLAELERMGTVVVIFQITTILSAAVTLLMLKTLQSYEEDLLAAHTAPIDAVPPDQGVTLVAD